MDREYGMFSNRQSNMTWIAAIMFLFVTIFHSAASQCNRDADGRSFMVLFTDYLSKKPQLKTELVYTSPSNAFNDTEVHIFTPKWTNPQVYESINIGPKTSGVSRLSQSLQLVDVEQASKVVLVESDYDILLYVLSHDPLSGNAFLALQTEVLGTEYYSITYWPPSTVAQVAIATLYDNTVVTLHFPAHRGIRFTYEGKEVIGGSEISIVLQEYEAIQLQDRNELTGTKITASKPIAVFSGNKRCSVNADINYGTSHMMIQVPPVSTWGKIFLLFPLHIRPHNVFKLVAQKANTTVRVTGTGVMLIWVSRFDGDFKSDGFVVANVPLTIQADKPIFVVQWAESRTVALPSSNGKPIDPAMTILPPVEQFKNRYSFSTLIDRSMQYFAIITIAEEDAKGLIVDGEPIDYSKWREFPDAMPLMVGRMIQIKSGWHEFYHIKGDVRFGVLVYGSSRRGMTNVYPAGMCMDDINPEDDATLSTGTPIRPESVTTAYKNNTDGEVFIVKIARGSNNSLDVILSSPTIALAILSSIILAGLVAVIILSIYCRLTRSFSAKSRAQRMQVKSRPPRRDEADLNNNGAKVKDNDLNCQSEIIRTVYGK